MLRQILIGSFILGSFCASASATVATSSTTASCVKTSDTPNKHGKYRYTCIQFDENGKVVDKWIEWRDSYAVPRSDRPSRFPGNDGKLAVEPAPGCRSLGNPPKQIIICGELI